MARNLDTAGLTETLRATLALVPGFGLLDPVPLDTDEVPMKLHTAEGRPYWNLTFPGDTNRPASIGGTSGNYQSFRVWTVSLEGWRAFRATDEETAEWAQLVHDAIPDRLRVEQKRAQELGYTGVTEYRNIRPSEVGTRRLRLPQQSGLGIRAHHARITFEVEAYLVQSRSSIL